ncbi:MAG TPA: FtsQ-type POTRA domain-containing protein [Vicinamibacterales bacterium]|nr:FtsQ-type POTRA domain-containing protein [Vicinamibacterales bacterium]
MLTIAAAGALGVRLLAIGLGVQVAVPQQEVIAEVRVHGNHISTDDEIVALSGLKIGSPFTTATIAEVTARLRAAKKFESVSVLKRFASISDPTQIIVVIIVDEGPVRIELPDVPGSPVTVVKRRGVHNLMWLPILTGEDGYGLTYGVRLAWPGWLGERSRVSFPLTWGGFKQAGAEFDRTFAAGPLTRVQAGGSLQSEHNPGFDEDDTRRVLFGRVERAMKVVRLAGDAAWQHVSFLGLTDSMRSFGGSVTVDTRIDPVLPRNAIYALASAEQVYTDHAADTTMTHLEARGYIGLVGQTTAVLSVQRQDATQPLPPYLKYLLGGNSTLRGFEAGSFIGDTVVNGSIELRVPLTSPLDIGKLGVSVFADTGKAYDKGQRFGDQPYHTGVGGSVWMAATAFHMSLAVAHGLGASTRVNFGIGFTF